MQEKRTGHPLKELAPFCRRAAAQGAVLLKNEGGMLPIKKEDHIAVFGRCQINFYRSGTGSGGLVNVEYETNLLDGLKSYPWVRLNEALITEYENWIEEHGFDNGDGMFASEPWHQEEMPLSDEVVKAASEISNKAIVVIGRTAGEEKDNADEPGSYRLTEEEQAMISLVTKYFTQVAVIFNVSNIIDMSWTEAKWCHGHIKALLYTWHGGIEGGMAAADLLVGTVSPSGHLTDTIAYSVKDYPSYANYGSTTCNFYEEDIYVGYRYFETFCPERVMYPFGFGLSYTTFDVQLLQTKVKGEGAESIVSVEVQVKNTGSYAGREVVQVYVEAPQGKLGQPKKALVNFAKTKLLEPGESVVLILDTPIRRFASYDDSGITGYKSCYVLEEGAYLFHVGTDCRNTKEALTDGEPVLVLDKLLVLEKLSEAAAPVRSFRRMKPGKASDGVYEIAYEPVPVRTIDIEKRIQENLPAALPAPERTDITFDAVKKERASLEAFAAQLSLRELTTIVRGEGMCNPRVTPGTAAAFGGVSDELAKRGIPAGCAADGPSGIRMDTGEKATQLPIGTLLACSFDADMVEELFYMEGKELVSYEIDTLLGPGINIHRYPLNGRNFEYFSEDPYVTGMFAAACEKGMDRAGSMGTLKHFACNNQEKARHTVDAVVSERALRQIYLKGFEMAVREGGARSVMTTYNPLNGYQNASHYDLTTTILRGEWGYKGIVMTDWWAKVNDVIEGGEGGVTDLCSMVRAQNDIYMTFNNGGAAINAKNDNLESAVAEGKLTVGELQRSAMNILRFLLEAKASEREVAVVEPAVIAPITLKEAEKRTDAKSAQSIACRIDLSGKQAETGSVLLKVEKAGTYGINVELMSMENERAQLLCQMYLNGEKAADIQTNGTRGMWHAQRAAEVVLSEGLYELTLKHIRPGIQFADMQFAEV